MSLVCPVRRSLEVPTWLVVAIAMDESGNIKTESQGANGAAVLYVCSSHEDATDRAMRALWTGWYQTVAVVSVTGFFQLHTLRS